MKTILLSVFIILFSINTYGQYNEFETHNNGLIYDENTVSQLKFIVDSLNLKFKACEITETYFSKLQSKVLVIKVNSKKVKKDFKEGINLIDFKKKYPNRKLSDPKLIVVDSYEDYNDIINTRFSIKSINDEYGDALTFKRKINPTENYTKGSWIYKDESDTVFYLLEDFQKKTLKDDYAHMIQYADCMIDTTSTKISENAENGYVEIPKNYKKLSLKKQKKLLQKMRNTRVVGMCSQDNSPRFHAINIAKLSAQTVDWEVFLKAHLDIMNDRFDRMSDGSYAQAQRQTYLKELEVLDIDITSLLFGISLRIENANKNHYYGSINRLGRAISDAKNKQYIENELIKIIADDELDDYNRYLMYYLYANYLYYSNESEEAEVEIEKQLESIKRSLPEYLISNI